MKRITSTVAAERLGWNTASLSRRRWMDLKLGRPHPSFIKVSSTQVLYDEDSFDRWLQSLADAPKRTPPGAKRKAEVPR